MVNPLVDLVHSAGRNRNTPVGSR